MKKIIVILLSLISLSSFSQLSSVNPDTVCFQSNASIYVVNNIPDVTYDWVVQSPGIITSGQGTNEITVDWSTAAVGLIPNAVSVYAHNDAGCESPVVNLDVFIHNIVVLATNIEQLCEASNCVDLTGDPLGGTWTGVGVVGNQFCPTVSGPGQFDITYTINSGGCEFTDVITISVAPEPILQQIQHD